MAEISGKRGGAGSRCSESLFLSQEDGPGRFSSYSLAVSLLQLCTVNGLWISASWVGVGRSPGYSHLGTREVKRSDLVYRERRNVAWVLAFVYQALC